jgi:hypothetical protein
VTYSRTRLNKICSFSIYFQYCEYEAKSKEKLVFVTYFVITIFNLITGIVHEINKWQGRYVNQNLQRHFVKNFADFLSSTLYTLEKSDEVIGFFN